MPYIPDFSIPYFENFENGTNGWTSGGFGSTWAFGTPNKSVIVGAHSGQNAWTNGGLYGSYHNNELSYLLSPGFNLSSVTSEVYVSFWIWYNTEPTYAGIVLQVSVNEGHNWTTVGDLNEGNWWYNSNVTALPGNIGKLNMMQN